MSYPAIGTFMILNVLSLTNWGMGGFEAEINPVTGGAPMFPLANRGRSSEQVWGMSKQTVNGQDWWTISNGYHPNTVTIQNGNATNGAPVVMVPNPHDDTSLWKIDCQTQGISYLPGPVYCTFTNKASGTVAELRNGGTANGTPIEGRAKSNGNPNQAFILIPV